MMELLRTLFVLAAVCPWRALCDEISPNLSMLDYYQSVRQPTRLRERENVQQQNKMTDQHKEALDILKDILSRYEYQSNNNDVIWEKSKIRLRNPNNYGDRRRQRPSSYKAGPVRGSSISQYGNSNHMRYAENIRNKQNLYYGDVSNIRQKPSVYPTVKPLQQQISTVKSQPLIPTVKNQAPIQRPQRPTSNRQPMNEQNYYSEEPGVYIGNNVKLPTNYNKPTTQYQYDTQTSSYQEENYESGAESDEHDSYENHQDEADYTENLENHQMNNNYSPYDSNTSAYDGEANVEKKKYRLKVNVILHNYRHGRNDGEIEASSIKEPTSETEANKPFITPA